MRLLLLEENTILDAGLRDTRLALSEPYDALIVDWERTLKLLDVDT